MNQELLGCTGGLLGDCKSSSFNGGIVSTNPQPALLSSSPSSFSSSVKTTTATSHSEKQILRCPRCDSSNTKFCYYNNYNLTQPRHFCKSCRRYWTKGGALRNIPIGGGCRKNRISHMPAAVRKSSSAKTKMFRSEIGRTVLEGNGFHQEFYQDPIFWNSSPDYQHLGLLRPPQKPNQAATSVGKSSSPENDPTIRGGLKAMTDMAARSSTFDSLNKSSSIGLSSSIWRTNEIRSQLQNECLEGDQEFHQKLRLSSGNIFTDHPSIFLSNTPSSSSSMLVSTPVAGGDYSRLNPAFSWSDVPTTNGSYLRDLNSSL